MPLRTTLAASIALGVAVTLTPGSASPLQADLARSLAEGHFEHLYAFNLLAAYESTHGRQTATFVLARRWAPDRTELLIHAHQLEGRQPWQRGLRKQLAGLLVHNLGRSDDLMVYVPELRKVHRVPAAELQKRPVFRLVPLGDFRPIIPGELAYRSLPDVVEDGRRLRVVEGRRIHEGQSFDRIELYFAEAEPLAVRTIFFADGHELRRVLIDPEDVKSYEGRPIAIRHRITTPDGGITDLRMRNILVDPALPAELFTEKNLWLQRFPRF
ncbi:MAG: outer membrane lipoprotein-sorting protein [Deltaproteobacteria bacterium]|nr:outer membrane lipoprotein-sorting protein [Deltaproteobacteria bacterium]MBW2413642.1 outer membrane lipoprotein-sorting protein [Deltaproteobacteria bacterium]